MPAQAAQRSLQAGPPQFPGVSPLGVKWPTKYGHHGAEFDYLRDREGHVPSPRKGQQSPLLVANAQQRALAGTSTQAGSWSPLGPAPILQYGYSLAQLSYTGRVLGLAYSPAGHAIYLGAADGGVWKSNDLGGSWTPLTDGMPDLAIGSLWVDPTDPTGNTVYAGTGEANDNENAFTGLGIYKTIDGGATWQLYGEGLLQGYKIPAIRVDPTNSSRVYAATKVDTYATPSLPLLGVAVSTDGGHTWTAPTGAGSLNGHDVMDLAIDTHGDLYAAVGGFGDAADGVYLSTDHGITWTKESTGVPDGSSGDQYVLGLAPSTAGNALGSQTLYVAVSDGTNAGYGTLLGIWRTTTAGAASATWTQIANSSTPEYYESQGWYDIYLSVDPTNAGTVYLGLTNIYKTTNGLAATPTWTDLTQFYLGGAALNHPDQHAALFVGSSIYFGNDGGVYRSDDGGGTFSSVNEGLALSQFYAGALGTANDRLLMGGLQDNGTVISDGSLDDSWVQTFGGDGTAGLIDPTNNLQMYGSYVYAKTYYSIGGGASWTYSRPPLDNAVFVAPLVFDPNNPSTLFVGQDHLWMSTNKMLSWTNVSSSISTNGIEAIGVSKSSPGTIYISDQDYGLVHNDFHGRLWVTTNAGTNWTPIGGICTISNRGPEACPSSDTHITGLAVDPTNGMILYATVNGFEGAQKYHVFRSSDGGTTWADVSTTLPDIPFQSVTVDPTTPTTVYAGSDIGVYVSYDSGSHWSVLGDPLPHVSVFQIVVDPSQNRLVAFTYGRGAWSIGIGSSRNSRVTPGPAPVSTNTPTPVTGRDHNRATPTPTPNSTPTAAPTAVGGRGHR